MDSSPLPGKNRGPMVDGALNPQDIKAAAARRFRRCQGNPDPNRIEFSSEASQGGTWVPICLNPFDGPIRLGV
jgi:hypothetical protein